MATYSSSMTSTASFHANPSVLPDAHCTPSQGTSTVGLPSNFKDLNFNLEQIHSVIELQTENQNIKNHDYRINQERAKERARITQLIENMRRARGLEDVKGLAKVTTSYTTNVIEREKKRKEERARIIFKELKQSTIKLNEEGALIDGHRKEIESIKNYVSANTGETFYLLLSIPYLSYLSVSFSIFTYLYLSLRIYETIFTIYFYLHVSIISLYSIYFYLYVSMISINSIYLSYLYDLFISLVSLLSMLSL